MTHPFDYFLSVANANSALISGMGEIARKNYTDFTRSGQNILADMNKDARSLQQGAVPAAGTEVLSAFWDQASTQNEASLNRVRRVLEEWQQALSQATERLLDQANDATSTYMSNIVIRTPSDQDTPASASTPVKANKTAA